ncbi:hypothetical protein ACIOZL_22545 [Streptomyces sp. NPDC087769]
MAGIGGRAAHHDFPDDHAVDHITELPARDHLALGDGSCDGVLAAASV